MKRFLAVITLMLAVFTAFPARGEATLKLGVLAYRPKPLTMAQWRPLAVYLQGALKQPVELTVYDHAELTSAAAQRSVDVVITTPNHFVLLQHTAGLSSPLATLVSMEGGHELGAYGGVIFTRADRGDIATLNDLSGKRIAAASTDAFGGYQMQALEMVEARVELPAAGRLLITGQPHDRVIEAVLNGRADAGFVRAGLIESLAREGRLDPARVKVINRQDLPAFPFAVSTRLYPEWPVAVMPQVDRGLASRLAAALFLLPHGSFKGPAAAVHGFDIPANYGGVENLLRVLRLPPFDRPPEFTFADLWRRYSSWIVALAGLLLLLTAASAGLVIMYRRSRQALREVERMAEKERLLLASLAEGVYGVDTGGNLIFLNPQALTMLGFSEEELIGKGSHPLFHGQREGSPCPEEECPVTLTLRDGVKRQIEDAFIRKDGTLFPVSLAVSAMRHEGAVVGAVVVFQDITERRRAEEEILTLNQELERRVEERTADLRKKSEELEESRTALMEIVADLKEKTGELERANERLKEADRAKSAFLASMSHELRTPLNSVIGFSTVLLNEWLGPVNSEQKENLARILSSGRRLLNMINDVLDVTQLESGTIKPIIEEFDLYDLLAEAENEVAAAMREKGLELRSQLLRQRMRTDRRRLLQCLSNILNNAVKFTDRGSVTMAVRLFPSTGEMPGGEMVEIDVTDTGIGIGEEDRSRIFHPFSRIVTPQRTIVPGTGLGLFLTRKIATEILKGDIQVSSECGKGSRFSLRIPVRLP